MYCTAHQQQFDFFFEMCSLFKNCYMCEYLGMMLKYYI